MRRVRQLLELPEPKPMSFSYYNPNPTGKSVGDCTVRAVAKALGRDWDEVYVELALEGFRRRDMPNADSVWGAYLKEHGFTRHWIPDACPDCYTVADFAADHPEGAFIVSMPGRHVLTVVVGVIFDSWDSGMEVPTYFWSKER